MTTYTSNRLLVAHRLMSDDYQVDRHVGWLNDPEVVKYSENRHKKHTTESQRSFMASILYPNRFMEIELRGTEIIIGTMTVYVDEPNKIAQVGILIGSKTKWGKGYGFEAWACVCDGLFSDGIRKIEAGCMETNLAMRAIFTKYRMFQEAYISRHFLLEDGSTTGEVRYGRFAD